MSADILLDTHIALWLDSGDERLRLSTRDLIDNCWRNDGTVLISAVTAWEVALLAERGRIDLDLPAADWIERFAAGPGVKVVPLSYRAAANAYRLHDFAYRDPADRLLIATSVELACPFVTYDARIARFAEDHGAPYGFTVGA